MPLVYTGPPDVIDKLMRIYRGAVPADVASQNRNLDEARVFAEMVALGEGTGFGWAREAQIHTSHGLWLDQHGRDLNQPRQGGEADPALRARIRKGPDALLRSVMLDTANAILASAGVAGTAALLRLPADAAYVGSYAPMTGTGGTFVQTGSASRFTPAVLPWPTPPFREQSLQPLYIWQLVIAGAAGPGNNGTWAITALGGIDGNAAVLTNAAGVGGFDPTVTWTAQRVDVSGNLTDGFARAYVNRGYRVTRTRPFTIVVILPFGTDAGTANSIAAAVRTKKAAGFGVLVEVRANP